MPVEYFDTTGSQNTNAEFYLPDQQYKKADQSAHLDSDIYRSNAHTISVYQVALPLIFGIIIAVGIAGNSLVIYVIATKRKLRTVTNFLLLNLAAADILFLVICGPLTVTHYALKVWTLGDAVCRTIQYFLYVTCYVTIYTLMAVAAVRYTLVVKGRLPACISNTVNILNLVLGIWIVCLLANIPVPVAYGVNEDAANNVTECVISCQVKGQRFFSLFFAFAYAIPLAVIAALYVMLVRHLAAERRRSMIHKPAGGGSDPERTKKSGHVTRVLVVVVVVFAVCWLPLHVHLLWGSFGELPTSFVYRMCVIVWHALVFVNSALNPLIYNFASSDFRDAFRSTCDPWHGKRASVSSASGSRGALLKS